MAEELIAQMAEDEIFVPTIIAEYPDPLESVEGAVMVQLTCKALAAGQALMAVGGYIVRGVVHSCQRRATAIRRPGGAFEMVPVEFYDIVGRRPAQPTAAAIADATATAETAAGSNTPIAGLGVGYLAIADAPYSESPETPKANLLPKLESQVQIDTKALPPVHERRRIFEKSNEDKSKITEDSGTMDDQQLELAIQASIEDAHANAELTQRQHDHDAATKLASVQMGKQGTTVVGVDETIGTTVKLLRDKVDYLENRIKRYTLLTDIP